MKYSCEYFHIINKFFACIKAYFGIDSSKAIVEHHSVTKIGGKFSKKIYALEIWAEACSLCGYKGGGFYWRSSCVSTIFKRLKRLHKILRYLCSKIMFVAHTNHFFIVGEFTISNKIQSTINQTAWSETTTVAIQIIVPCGNRNRDPPRSCQSLSHFTSRVVNVSR